jgi:hypothetical protein
MALQADDPNAARTARHSRAKRAVAVATACGLTAAFHGTGILIHSGDLAAGALADLAAGLVRAPSVPPDLGA